MRIMLRKRIGMALILPFLATFTVSGCTTQVPYPIPHKLSTQKKMQAAQHWEMLARDVAEQVRFALNNIHRINHKPIYVKSYNSTPFHEVFHGLLISHLVQKGLAVSCNDQDAIVMEYQARIVAHSERFVRHPPIKYTVLGGGLNVARRVMEWSSIDLMNLGFATGLAIDGYRNLSTGDLSNKEVIISTGLTYHDRYLMHQSDIYYINEPDGWHYDETIDEKQKAEKTDKQAKTYNVVN